MEEPFSHSQVRTRVFWVVRLGGEPHPGAAGAAGLGGGVVGPAAVPRQTDLE